MDNLFSTAWIDDFERRIGTTLFPSSPTSEQLPSWRAAAQAYVRQQPNCHLFVCCNYRPDPKINNPAADYKTAILNLYRFTKDSGPVVNNWWKICYGEGDSPQKQTFFQCRDVVELLRAVTAHNTSEENGPYEAAQVKAYQKWCLRRIGKTAPRSDNDYIVLTREVEQLSNEICDYLENGLQHLQTLSRDSRQTVFRRWENTITDFFTSDGVKSNTIRGFLIAAYCDEHGEDYPYDQRSLNRYKKRSYAWLYEHYFHDKQIEQLKQAWANGDTNPSINERLQKLLHERSKWETAALSQLPHSRCAVPEDVRKKMVQLCEEDFFKRGLKSYWRTLLISNASLPSMLPKYLLPRYISYKLRTEGARNPEN